MAMQNTTRTLAGTALQVAKNLGIAHQIDANSTLNQKFEIFQNVLPAGNEVPAVRYYSIGAGGHRMTMGTNGVPKTVPYDYDPRNAALYAHLPFVLRPVLNDLPVERRVNYGLRKRVTVGGDDYFAYYLKRLDLTGVTITKKVITKVNGEDNETPFIYTAANLSPARPTIANSGATQTTGDAVYASANIAINFDAFDVSELIEACKILYNDEEMAIVSEIGLVSGVDREVTGTTGTGASIQYQEVIAAQLAAVIPTFHPLTLLNEGFLSRFDLGEKEPLITSSTQTVV